MKGEIIAVGTELLAWEHSEYKCPVSFTENGGFGHDVFYHVAVGDNMQRLVDTVRTSLNRWILLSHAEVWALQLMILLKKGYRRLSV